MRYRADGDVRLVGKDSWGVRRLGELAGLQGFA